MDRKLAYAFMRLAMWVLEKNAFDRWFPALPPGVCAPPPVGVAASGETGTATAASRMCVDVRRDSVPLLRLAASTGPRAPAAMVASTDETVEVGGGDPLSGDPCCDPCWGAGSAPAAAARVRAVRLLSARTSPPPARCCGPDLSGFE